MNETNLLAFNVLEIHRDFIVGECPHCLAQFRVNSSMLIPVSIRCVDSGVVCPNCAKVSYNFDWMDDSLIPRVY